MSNRPGVIPTTMECDMKHVPIGLHAVAVAVLIFGDVAHAEPQDAHPFTAAPITREQADAMLAELRAIHQLLDRQAPPVMRPSPPAPTVRMAVAQGWYALGRDDAPLTIVEFSDYQCPYCRRFHLETFPELKKNYVDTGKVRFVSRDLPLDFHPNALRAAEAARCAGDQKK